MDGSTASKVEAFLAREIMMYHDLRRCFHEEREALINIDVDALWQIARDKENACSRITAGRQGFKGVVGSRADGEAFDLSGIIAGMPAGSRPHLQRLNLELKQLKTEIEASRRENKGYIDHSIEFMDEMIAVMAGGGEDKTYDRRCLVNRHHSQFLLQREV